MLIRNKANGKESEVSEEIWQQAVGKGLDKGFTVLSTTAAKSDFVPDEIVRASTKEEVKSSTKKRGKAK